MACVGRPHAEPCAGSACAGRAEAQPPRHHHLDTASQLGEVAADLALAAACLLRQGLDLVRAGGVSYREHSTQQLLALCHRQDLRAWLRSERRLDVLGLSREQAVWWLARVCLALLLWSWRILCHEHALGLALLLQCLGLRRQQLQLLHPSLLHDCEVGGTRCPPHLAQHEKAALCAPP
ncbi:hypothetical protein DUNSADRAFT_7289 [Dunaliella salina]|uniref:Uncharacterized protein n=1 Tax=Dunaliella salina TaxID=3046 RepID=A0ABQ7GLM2_DUNSA|nr:hypothetical protein DUNSADRAFT_7289 [Dunaliella salina]|eukprot:KAF5835505.1 hypothetical protein DUNSADRAFT_7289 [Dunaliella salina]